MEAREEELESPLLSAHLPSLQTVPVLESLATDSRTNGRGCSTYLQRFWTVDTKIEAWVWWQLSWPVGIAIFARNVHQFVDLVFLGHLGTDYLAAAGIANMFLVVTSAWLWKSFGNALNALCAQADGAGNRHLIGSYLNIAVILTIILCLPIGISWIFTGEVMHLFGFDAAQCNLASEFARYFTLGLYPSMIYTLLSNYLQSLHSVMPVLLINCCMVGVNALLNWVLVFGISSGTALGFRGSPIATALTQWTALICVLSYIRISGIYKGTWSGMDRDTWDWRRWRIFLSQALPIGIGNLFEDLQLQVLGFLAAQLGDAAIATHNGFLYLFFVVTSLMYGSVKASTIRIGYYLGARNVVMAVRVALINFMFTGGMGLVIGSLLVLLRQYIGHIFSDDPTVWANAETIAVPVGLGYFGLALFFACMAVLQGQGRSGVVALAFILGAWGVAVPMGFVFTHVLGRGLVGIWLALVAGYSSITLVAGIAVACSNWPALAERAVERAQSRKQHTEEANEPTTLETEAMDSTVLGP
jgi:MATE family multidrug resistance protein